MELRMLPLLLVLSVGLIFTGFVSAQPSDAELPLADSTMVSDSMMVEDTVAATVEEPAPVAETVDETAAVEEEPSPGMFSQFAEFFRKGGFAMWPILLFFAAGLAIVIERSIFLFSTANMKPEEFMGRIAELIRKGSIEGAIASCAEKSAPLARIIESALRNYRNTERDIQNAVDEMALAELPRLSARTPYLATLANVSTMVGLLGTIFGLIVAFASVAVADPAEKSIILANGISMAMNTTAFGLTVAIPLLLAHAVITAKTDSLVDDIDRYSVMVINMLAQARKEG
jgi:biopolymer transport protein ExbB